MPLKRGGPASPSVTLQFQMRCSSGVEGSERQNRGILPRVLHCGEQAGWSEGTFTTSAIRGDRSENDRHEGASAPSLTFNQNWSRWTDPRRKIGKDHGRLLEFIDDRMGTHIDRTLKEGALFQ